MRLRALVLLTALGATLLPVGASAAADPAGSTEVAVLGVGPGVNGFRSQTYRGLATLDLPVGTRATFAGQDAVLRPEQLDDLAVSDSGDRIAYRVAATDAIAVRDLSGAGVGLLDPLEQVDVNVPQAHLEPGPGLGLSSDGNRVVWRRQVEQQCAVRSSELRTASVTGGAVRTLVRSTGDTGFYEPVFLTDDLLVVGVGRARPVDDSTCLGQVLPALDGFRLLRSDGTLGAAVAVPPASGDFAGLGISGLSFNADRTAVTYQRGTVCPLFFCDGKLRVETAPVTLTATSLVLGTPTVLTSYEAQPDPLTPLAFRHAKQPRFSRDGSRVLFLGDGALFSVPRTGGTPVQLDQVVGAQDGSGFTVLGVGRRESVPPSAAPDVDLDTSGPTVRVTVLGPADPTLGQVRLTRTLDGAQTTRLLPLAGSRAVVTDRVPVGRAVTYTAQLQDRSGGTGPVSAPVTTSPASLRATVQSGGTLVRRQQLRSPAGHNAQLGADGNFVVYAPSAAVLFQTRTRGATTLRVQRDGNLVLTNGLGRVFWQSRTGGQGPAGLVLQRDGNLVLYRDSDGKALWSSKRA